jgi:hypothetical protein
MMNKKGQIITKVSTVILGLIILGGIIAALTISWGIVKIGNDEIVPELLDIGEIAPGINISEHIEIVTTPMTIIIDNLGLIMGLIYIFGIVGLLSYSYIMRTNVNGWVIALFFAAVLLVILLSIATSQFYEEFYLGQDDLGENLREASLVSYLIIYSPVILTIVAFVAGIILFTGEEEPFR